MPYRSGAIDSEILAVHAALIPGGAAGRVLLFGGDEHHGSFSETSSSDGWKKTRVYDIATGSLLMEPVPSPDSDVFCAGHAFLPDGRLLIGGGTSTFPVGGDPHAHGLSFGGHKRCWIYNPSENEWVEAAEMLPEPGEESGGGRWYPTLTTLGTGEVIAFFGHPHLEDSRHRNTIAEKYNAIGDYWTGLPQMADPTRWPLGGDEDVLPPEGVPPERVRHLFYPRCFQLPDGNLFFATGMPVTDELVYHSTLYDPGTGDYVGETINEPGGYSDNWRYPCCLLPLLPEENYRARVFFAGRSSAKRIDLGAANPSWQTAGSRELTIDDPNNPGTEINPNRIHGMAVLLPTGEVCSIGGVHRVNEEIGTLQAEIYDPGINWTLGDYSGTQSWSTDASEAKHARNYHSVALLLPDGSIWIGGGNTNGRNGNPDSDVTLSDGTEKKLGIKEIEIYDPPYMAEPGRPNLFGAPSAISYGQRFEASVNSGVTVQRAALIRFGSATHGSNYDQRYVGLEFDQDGAALFLNAPPNGNVAPPGFYMLWVVDDDDKPCQQAAIVRLGSMACDLVHDRSSFSIHEIESLLLSGSPARVDNAVYAVFDGFRPSELPEAHPGAELFFEDDNTEVPNNRMRLVPQGARHLEDSAASADEVQRVTYVYRVEFNNTQVFTGFPEERRVRIEISTGAHQCRGRFVLLNQPNPYMLDIDGDLENPHWLSVDLRVFQIEEGRSRAGVEQNTSGPDFITELVGEFRGRPDDDDHPFRDIDTDQSESKLELSRSVNGKRVFNYAIAKVRYRAISTNADNVQVFFRMFTTAATDLRYRVNEGYRRDGDWPNSTPLLGKVGGELVSFPCFAAPRVDTTVAGGDMTDQNDPLNHETIPAGGADEVVMYFGAWLDFNQTTPRFPLLPGDSDGPFLGTTQLTRPRSLQELIRGAHQCLAAEVRFQPGANDPIPNGSAPSQSDRVAQRNLSIVESDNPGGPASRTLAHTFELAPSPTPPQGYPVGAPFGKIQSLGPRPLTHVKSIIAPDELFIRWGNFPAGSDAEIMFGDLDVDEILALAATRQGPTMLRKIGASTLSVRVGETVWIPIPGGREQNIASLIAIRLPEGVRKGDHYTASVAQVAGRTRQVIGAFQISAPVMKAADLRADEVRGYSVLQHIAQSIPLSNRWHPVFSRYLEFIAARVDAFGTDPADVYPNPDGTGEPWRPGDDDRPHEDDDDGVIVVGDGRPGKGVDLLDPSGPFGHRGVWIGRVGEIVYDECGCLRGFILVSCRGERKAFRLSEPHFEALLQNACEKNLRLAVRAYKGCSFRISIICC